MTNVPELAEIAASFKNYSSIIEFILEFDKSIKISKSSISHLRNRKIIFKQVPRTKETTAFVTFVKTKFPNFNEEFFFRK